jgi:shikimate kinase
MKNRIDNLILIGPMGAGKSSIGKRLAQKLQHPFYETDHQIEVCTGVDLSWVFDLEGEAGFRQRELDVLRQLCMLRGIVLSTGGGTIELQQSRELIAQSGLVVYLQVDFEHQLDRIRRSPVERPVLARYDNEQSALKELARRRDPHYQALADVTFDTSQRVIADIVNDIISAYRSC